MYSWSAGNSFLAAVSSSMEDDTGLVCVLDDDEQTDKHLEQDTGEQKDNISSEETASQREAVSNVYDQFV